MVNWTLDEGGNENVIRVFVLSPMRLFQSCSTCRMIENYVQKGGKLFTSVSEPPDS